MWSIKMNNLHFLALMVACLIAFAQAGIDISNINVNDIQQQLPGELANYNISFDKAKNLLRDKCIQNIGEEKGNEAHEKIIEGAKTLGECFSNLVNYTALQAEIEEAKPNGELDVVFNKYCKKRPEAMECLEDFNKYIAVCLDKDEQESQDMIMRIIRNMINFICHKGGDQIALFIAEKGPECLESKRDDIQDCVNATLSPYMPEEGLDSVKTLPKFVMEQKQCDDIERVEKCIVGKLETCEEITPANIVESMFRFVKNETICKDIVRPTSAKQADRDVKNAAAVNWHLTYYVAGLMMGILLLLGKRF